MQVLNVNPGFTSTGVVTARLALSESHYATPESRTAFYDTVISKFAALPGVSSVGAVSFLPMTGMELGHQLRDHRQAEAAHGSGARDGRPHRSRRLLPGDGDPAAVGPLLPGDRLRRPCPRGDHQQGAGRSAVPGQDPIGHELVINWDTSIPDRIVGVVGNVRHDGLETPVSPMIYWPHTRFSNDFMAVVVKTNRPALAIAPEMIRVVRSTDACSAARRDSADGWT